jgi:predicted nucleotidyltransferase
MAALTGKLRSAIQIQSTEVTQEYVENVLDVYVPIS